MERKDDRQEEEAGAAVGHRRYKTLQEGGGDSEMWAWVNALHESEIFFPQYTAEVLT